MRLFSVLSSHPSQMLLTKLSTHVAPISVSSSSFMDLGSSQFSLSGLDTHSTPYLHSSGQCLYSRSTYDLNPKVYGIKTKQIQDLVVHLLFSKADTIIMMATTLCSPQQCSSALKLLLHQAVKGTVEMLIK